MAKCGRGDDGSWRVWEVRRRLGRKMPPRIRGRGSLSLCSSVRTGAVDLIPFCGTRNDGLAIVGNLRQSVTLGGVLDFDELLGLAVFGDGDEVELHAGRTRVVADMLSDRAQLCGSHRGLTGLALRLAGAMNQPFANQVAHRNGSIDNHQTAKSQADVLGDEAVDRRFVADSVAESAINHLATMVQQVNPDETGPSQSTDDARNPIVVAVAQGSAAMPMVAKAAYEAYY